MIYFAQAIRERKTYTDFMIGLIMLARYYSNENKTFYIKKDIVDVFKNKKFKFYNLENNPSYKILRNIRLKATKNLREDPMHRDDTNLKQLYINRITKDSNINDMYLNDYNNNVNNFLLDNTVKFYYLKKYNKELHYYKNNKNKNIDKDSLKVSLKLKIDNNKINSFDKEKYFITLPTFRIDNDIDKKMLSIFCDFLISETQYKKLILISGSNEYKKYFYDKFGIETTHSYDNGFTSKKVGYNKEKAGFIGKDKGSLESLLTDCFYIQESAASYIDFMQIYNSYKEELFKFGLAKYKNYYYNTFISRNKSQAIDIIGKELKNNKVFYV